MKNEYNTKFIAGDSRRSQTPTNPPPIDTRFHGNDAIVRQAIREATNRVNSAVNQTMEHLFDRNRTHSVQELTAIFRYPSTEALALARAEEIFEQTLEIVYRHVRDGHEYNLTDSGISNQTIFTNRVFLFHELISFLAICQSVLIC